jgi:hypothetical protein
MKVASDTASAPKRNLAPVSGAGEVEAVVEGMLPPEKAPIEIYLICQISDYKKGAVTRDRRLNLIDHDSI